MNHRDWPRPEGAGGPEKEVEELLRFAKDNFRSVALGLLLLVGAFIVMSSVYTVQAGQQAVVKRFGKWIATEGQGLKFKLPLIDHVQKVPTTTQIIVFDSVGERGSDRGIQSGGPDSSMMLTGDLFVVDVPFSVSFRVGTPEAFLFNVENPQKNIEDLSQSVMRRVVGDRPLNVVFDERDALGIEATQELAKLVEEYGLGIDVEAVRVDNVRVPAEVREAREAVSSATSSKNSMITVAETTKTRAVSEARGRAGQRVSQAKGQAAIILGSAKSEATRIERILPEYKVAPELVKTRLYLETMEHVLQKIRGLTVINPDLRGVLPVMSGTNTQPTSSNLSQQAAVMNASQQFLDGTEDLAQRGDSNAERRRR